VSQTGTNFTFHHMPKIYPTVILLESHFYYALCLILPVQGCLLLQHSTVGLIFLHSIDLLGQSASNAPLFVFNILESSVSHLPISNQICTNIREKNTS
jgi:hypothetical protein